MQATATDPSKARRVELILSQIETLPTLPAIATRLMTITASDASDAREVSELIKADQALTARILSLCRQADLGVRNVKTVDQAIVLLGFNTIRNVVLSQKVVELFRPNGQADQHEGDGPAGPAHLASQANQPHFDYVNFWRHCLGVAIVAELIAGAHPGTEDLPPAEAFACGLLHDIGKLALDQVLPRSFDRVVELVEMNQGNIAEFERRIIGIDHHTAGKRLAEKWQLPHMLQDCIWLHGSPYEILPELDHKRMIALVGLADLIVRHRHLGYSGNFTFNLDAVDLSRQMGLDVQKVEKATKRLHEQLEQRSRALGLDEKPSRELFMASIQQANTMLGRLNSALECRTRSVAKRSKLLDALSAFHANETPGRSVQDVLGAVVLSAAEVLGPGYYAMLYQQHPDQPWLVCQYNGHAVATHSQLIEPPPHTPDLESIDSTQPMEMNLMGLLPWIADLVRGSQDLREIKLLTLGCGWGTAAVMLHDRAVLPDCRSMQALTYTWGSAVAAAAQHDGARRLGEQLAEANRVLAETQDRLMQSESMVSLGEMAAGAAHEMNNPLAVISGRSQLLARSLESGSESQRAAQTIVDQAHSLSDLITSLRLFADPPRAIRRLTSIESLLPQTIGQIRQDLPLPQRDLPINLCIQNDLPSLSIDQGQISDAVRELLLNAIQAGPATSIQVNVRAGHDLIIAVSDDGPGMDMHAVSHALDPFFSAKAAGRRAGMGLPRAQQWAAAHGGTIDLRSEQGRGTTATLTIPLNSSQ